MLLHSCNYSTTRVVSDAGTMLGVCIDFLWFNECANSLKYWHACFSTKNVALITAADVIVFNGLLLHDIAVLSHVLSMFIFC